MPDSLEKELDASVCPSVTTTPGGAIQPHGALLAVDPQWRCVRAASANLAELTGMKASDALGQSPAWLLGTSALESLALGLETGQASAEAMSVPLLANTQRRRLHLSAHATERGILLELEPQAAESGSLSGLGVFWSARIAASTEERETLVLLLQALRALTGFTTAAAVRLQDGNPHHESIEDPACTSHSDIVPHRALPPLPGLLTDSGALHLIANARARPARLLVAGAETLDLSRAILRPATQVQREYLQQCQSRAMLSLGLYDAGQLQALVVCQARRPHYLAPPRRHLLLQLAQLAAQRYVLLRERRESQRRKRLLDTFDQPTPHPPLSRPVETLLAAGADWLHHLDACGMGLVYQGKCLGLGLRPEDTELVQLGRLLDARDLARQGHSLALDRDDIASRLPQVKVDRLLAAPLGGPVSSAGWLMLFRQAGSEPPSRPWQAGERETAAELGRRLASHIAVWRAQRRCRRLGERNARLRQLAYHDPVTCVANRHRIEQLLEEQLTTTERHRLPCSVMLLDVDHFKRVNDMHGHEAGDRVLRLVARQIQARLRITDHVGRWGGEEFVIVAPGCGLDEAHELAERLCRQLGDTPMPPAGRVTASIGVTTWRPGDTPRRLVKRADRAMYLAKREGRARVCTLVDDD